MKKITKLLLIGSCLALSLGGLAACGGDDEPPAAPKPVPTTEQSNYYLAGKSSSMLFATAFGAWTPNPAGTAIPDSIALFKTDQADTFMTTVSLFAGDEFQILVKDDGWNGQLGGEKLDPMPAEGDETSALYSTGGIVNGNIGARTDGKYELILRVGATGSETKVHWERIGDADPSKPEYEYWVKGDNISGGKAANNELTKFVKTDWSHYTKTVNLKANEEFSILNATYGESIGKDSPATAITLSGAGASEIEAATGTDKTNVYKAKTAGSYTFTITETDTLGSDNKYTTTRAVAVTKADTKVYDLYIKSSGFTIPGSTDKDALMNKVAEPFVLAPITAAEVEELNLPSEFAGKQMYLWGGEGGALKKGDGIEIDVCPDGKKPIKEGDVAADITYKLKTEFMSTEYEYMTHTMNYKTLKVIADDVYYIAVDPDSFTTYVISQEWAAHGAGYTVYAHGDWKNDGNWGENTTTSTVFIEDAVNDVLTAEITLDLKNGNQFGFKDYKSGNTALQGDQLSWAAGAQLATGVTLPTELNAGDDGKGNFKATADCKVKFTMKITTVDLKEDKTPAGQNDEVKYAAGTILEITAVQKVTA